MDGLEIANGYHELIDVAEQRARFERDRAVRKAAEPDARQAGRVPSTKGTLAG